MFPGELINSSKQGPARQHRGTHWGKSTVSTLRTELVMKLLCTNVDKSLYLKSTNFLKKVKNGDPDMFGHGCRVAESKINQKHIF